MINRLKHSLKKYLYSKKYHYKILSNSVSLNALKGSNCEFMENVSVDSNCSIGSYVYVGKNTFVTKARVGNYTQIGSESAIGPGEHTLSNFSINSIFMDNPYEDLTRKEVDIGNDVWIGTHVIILRGVKIGNGAIIGAGAVVTKDVEPYGVYVGVPARLIKYRFGQDTIVALENSKWWDFDPDKVKEIIRNLNIKEMKL